ncbi:unnamed protein product [Penicillium palitans]
MVPVPTHPRDKDHSIPVELPHVATEKGPLLALKLGGLVLLYLLLREDCSLSGSSNSGLNAARPMIMRAATRPAGNPVWRENRCGGHRRRSRWGC